MATRGSRAAMVATMFLVSYLGESLDRLCDSLERSISIQTSTDLMYANGSLRRNIALLISMPDRVHRLATRNTMRLKT
jgi:hypothetical protein